MDVGMEMQVARPGLEHGEDAKLRAEVLVLAPDVEQRCCGLADQERVEDFLVGTDDGAQLFGHGERDQVVGHGQQAPALFGQPLRGIGVAALGTGPVIAGVIDQLAPAAVATVELRAQCRSAAGEDGLDGAPMRRQQTGAKLAFIRRPVAAQDCGQRDHGK